MIYDLPTFVEIQGVEYSIRSDYRAVLDICIALSDVELEEQEKALVALDIFYPDLRCIPVDHLQEALQKCFDFINCGREEGVRKAPKLVDWEQDFQHIVAPVNRVLGQEIRAIPYLHWWSFISAYYEIGECLFAQIVRIRNARARGKPLDKADKEWLRQNRHLVDFKARYTQAEKELLAQWT